MEGEAAAGHAQLAHDRLQMLAQTTRIQAEKNSPRRRRVGAPNSLLQKVLPQLLPGGEHPQGHTEEAQIVPTDTTHVARHEHQRERDLVLVVLVRDAHDGVWPIEGLCVQDNVSQRAAASGQQCRVHT